MDLENEMSPISRVVNSEDIESITPVTDSHKCDKEYKEYYTSAWLKVCYYYTDFDSYLKEVHKLSKRSYNKLKDK